MSQLFLDNKYTRWYYAIITRAQNRTTVERTETHHIIPKCFYKMNSKWGTLEGNSEVKSNLVSLTIKEHYIAHLLLTKMVIGTVKQAQMSRALERCLNINDKSQKDRYKIGARKYQQIRQASADANSVFITGDNNPQKRKEVRDKTSTHTKAAMQTPVVKANFMAGINSKSWRDARAKRVGSKGPNVDSAIYLFVHRDGRMFQGTQIEFREAYNITKYSVSRLIVGKLASTGGWELFYRPGAPNKQYKNKN